MHESGKILFSIIISTYNRAEIIGRAIESVLAQTYAKWELVVIDDGSTDNTKEVVLSFNDDRIRYFWKDNEERSIARNFGLSQSKGIYVSFLDDDDYYLPEFLEKFYKKIIEENFPVGLLMCDEFTEDEKGNRKLNIIPKHLLNKPVRLLWEIKTSIRPFVIHKEILTGYRFKENCSYGQDFHLAIRIALNYPFSYIPEALSVNKIHSGQGSHLKFKNNYKKNAQMSISCIDDLIDNNKNELVDKIPQAKLYDLHNHKVYGFASSAMKHCDFRFWWYLLNKMDTKGSFDKNLYYLLSLVIRMPFYLVKCLFKIKR